MCHLKQLKYDAMNYFNTKTDILALLLMIIAIQLKDYAYNYYSDDKDSLQIYSCTRDHQDIMLIP